MNVKAARKNWNVYDRLGPNEILILVLCLINSFLAPLKYFFMDTLVSSSSLKIHILSISPSVTVQAVLQNREMQ